MSKPDRTPSAARDHDGTWIEAGPDTEIVAGGDSAEEETAMFAAEIVRQSSAATLRRDALEWATTLEFVGAERMGAEWKDAGLTRADADELAVLLRALAANLRTGRIIHGDA